MRTFCLSEDLSKYFVDDKILMLFYESELKITNLFGFSLIYFAADQSAILINFPLFLLIYKLLTLGKSYHIGIMDCDILLCLLGDERIERLAVQCLKQNQQALLQLLQRIHVPLHQGLEYGSIEHVGHRYQHMQRSVCDAQSS